MSKSKPIPLGPVEQTHRGFEIIKFRDYAGQQQCSLQQSSLALCVQPGAGAIWLGVDDPNPMIMKRDALKLGMDLPDDDLTGWMPYPVPPEVLIHTRMQLDREKVARLIVSLNQWLKTGSFEIK